jgi:hypothetical protein
MTPEEWQQLEPGDTIVSNLNPDIQFTIEGSEPDDVAELSFFGENVTATVPSRWNLVKPCDPYWSVPYSQWRCRVGHLMRNTDADVLWRVVHVRTNVVTNVREYVVEGLDDDRQDVSMWSRGAWEFIQYMPEQPLLKTADPELERLLDEEQAIHDQIRNHVAPEPYWDEELNQWVCRVGDMMIRSSATMATSERVEVVNARRAPSPHGPQIWHYTVELPSGTRETYRMDSQSMWQRAGGERNFCPVCGQPDNIGDCNHERPKGPPVEVVQMHAVYVPTPEHKADVERIQSWLIREATERGWCPDFERCLRDVNPSLHVKFEGRKLQEGVAEVRFRVRWTGDEQTTRPMDSVDEAEIIQALRAMGLRHDTQFDSNRAAHFRVTTVRVEQIRQV